MKHRENSNITEHIRSFQRQQISTNIMKLLSPSTKMFKDIKKTHKKGITTKTTKNTQTTMLPSMLRCPKETCSRIVKEGLRTKEIFFGKKKITAFIDSGSTVSLLRENTSTEE
ncbi:hypothetical protein TNCT_374041 [Trichonephila clavata]|uniref:Uncharacterized protein n=1 Tax=Trichonephila clavata TaxID=2740835 RepID=A0A8X6HHW1_TRICU|nr:hypothetical protein TNCT_374041 [Trichonephila clavata]